MAETKQEIVKQLREKVYFLLAGHGGAKTWGTYQSLPPKFDEELLNDIAKLQAVKGKELEELVAGVRAKIAICVATQYIGEADEEPLNVLLDKVLQV